MSDNNTTHRQVLSAGKITQKALGDGKQPQKQYGGF